MRRLLHRLAGHPESDPTPEILIPKSPKPHFLVTPDQCGNPECPRCGTEEAS